MRGNRVIRIEVLLGISILFFCIYTFICPLIPSIDSIAGFLTYKGSLTTGNFNYYAEVSSSDLSKDDSWFVSWWSPGQWIFPAIFNYFFGLPLGAASIVVTVAGALSGLLGFYRLFRSFGFEKEISIASLFVIFASYTFFYSFVVYQGGEILSFAIFPWFALAVVKSRSPSFKVLFWIFVLFIVCFIAKTTLLIYCFMVLISKAISGIIQDKKQRQDSLNIPKQFLYLLPGIIASLIIYFSFLARGVTPPATGSPELSFQDVLIPVASPLLSSLSLQQIIARVVNVNDNLEYYILSVCVAAVFIFIIFRSIVRSKYLLKEYKTFFFIVYGGVIAFFIFIYTINIPVDHSSRHFKFLGYLLIPGIITLLVNKIKQLNLNIVSSFVCLLGILFFIYIKQGWIKDRFISGQYFYRNFDNKELVDKLDVQTYSELLRRAAGITSNNNIVYVEANADLAMDLSHRVITKRLVDGSTATVYKGEGPQILACIGKETYNLNNNKLRDLFPDYKEFKVVGETNSFLFFISVE